jgi:serine-type D-Ala-D-Ala carboxypeptidase (penicillin-binding protein 5/6)
MSRHVKNIELVYEKQPIPIAHQRNGRFDDSKNRLQDLNFWKMFTRMPRTNSYTQKQNSDERIEEYLSREDEKLIVISSFKNTDTTSDSLTKNFRLHRQKIRRYISDEDFLNTAKNSEKNSKARGEDNEEGVELGRTGEQQKSGKVELANLPSLQDEQNQSDILVSKRSVLSGNHSQLKAKQRIARDVGKKVINLPERASSKVRLPELK